MTWTSWFPGRAPDRIGLAEMWHEAGRRALAEADCKVGWLPSGAVVDVPGRGPVVGFAERARRRIYSPPPDSMDNLLTLLHECGHICADFGPTELESEARANSWALGFWVRHGLPDIEIARFSLARRLESAIRRSISTGSVSPAAALAVVPDELLADINVAWIASLEPAA